MVGRYEWLEEKKGAKEATDFTAMVGLVEDVSTALFLGGRRELGRGVLDLERIYTGGEECGVFCFGQSLIRISSPVTMVAR